MDKTLRQLILLNADYGDCPAGFLSDQELGEMNQKVEDCLVSTNGDTGECTITARQLALLLKTVVKLRSS